MVIPFVFIRKCGGRQLDYIGDAHRFLTIVDIRNEISVKTNPVCQFTITQARGCVFRLSTYVLLRVSTLDHALRLSTACCII
jgi:hypothetical protein